MMRSLTNSLSVVQQAAKQGERALRRAWKKHSARAATWFLAREKYGLDPLRDIKRLAATWDYPLTLVLDVGANDGGTARLALRAFPTAQVISFEPHPATFAQLTDRLGRHPRFRATAVALGSEIGEAQMFEYPNSGVNSLVSNAPFAVHYGRTGRSISIKSTTLDQFCEERGIGRVDVLKIDTEGFDHVVLQGARELLQRQAIKFVYVEFNDLQPKDGVFGGALMPIDALLRPHGYRFVASYNDYIVRRGMFCVSNALFALPPPTALLAEAG
jgi:FkbM family methyltransferase